MIDQTVTLPFALPDSVAGLVECSGLARATPSELALEFVLKDGLLNVLKSGVKEIRIPRSEIEVIRLKRGWFGTSVRIRVKSLKWLANLPDCDNGELTLHIARQDRDRAAELVRLLSREETSPPTPPA